MSKSSVLFWEKGYSETSMKDIAGACGFRASNIYNFFKSKEEILYEILLDEMNEIILPVRFIKDDEEITPPEQLRIIIENHVKLTLGIKRSSKLLFEIGLRNLSHVNRKKIIKLRDEYDRITGSVIQRGIDKGFFSETNVKMVVFSIASMIVRTRLWYSPKGPLSVNEIIDFIYNFIINSLKIDDK